MMAAPMNVNVTNQNTSEFWNITPSKPATCTMPVYPVQEQIDHLRKGKTTLTTCVQCLSQQQQLMSEYFVLNKLLYMKHGQLRREKSFLGLKQIRSCLKRFFSYGLEKVLQEFQSDFENAIFEEGIMVRLPSRQMWEYLLTHYLGAAALLTNTASRCATVFLHVHRHLTSGNLIPINMVFLSLLSRIWSCCQALCLDLQTWYLGLIPVKDVLKSTNFAWLPEGETLPEDLSTWLLEQGLEAGLVKQQREAGKDDLAMLMEMCCQQDTKGFADEATGSAAVKTATLDDTLPVSMDTTLPIYKDDDFGVPVSISDVEVESEDGDSQATGRSTKVPSKQFLPGLRKKILKAPTVRDLQLLLKKFNKKFPECSTEKKRKKCATFLTDLKSQAKVLEMRGSEERMEKLLQRGRKRVLKFIKRHRPLR